MNVLPVLRSMFWPRRRWGIALTGLVALNRLVEVQGSEAAKAGGAKVYFSLR